MKSQDVLKYAKTAARAADERLGEDIVALDVRRQTSVADVFLFVTATSHIHVRALEDAMREALGAEGAQLRRTDGQRGHHWRALDYGSLIIHIMEKATREFYSIERLWEEAKILSVLKADTPAPKKKAARPKAAAPRKKPARKKARK